MALSSNARRLSDNRSDGTVLGNSATDLVSFHGADTVAQVALSATAAVATTIPAHVSAGVYGFTLAQGQGLIALINALRAALVTKGLAST